MSMSWRCVCAPAPPSYATRQRALPPPLVVGATCRAVPATALSRLEEKHGMGLRRDRPWAT
eukprot:9471494-Pyramimonas_sp.AAC.1